VAGGRAIPGDVLAVWLVNTLLALAAVVVGLLVYRPSSKKSPAAE